MRNFEDWIIYVMGVLGFIGMTVTARVIKVQDLHAERIGDQEAEIAATKATVEFVKETLERMESKLDRVIEREHGA